jgi:hypothetical protein
MRRRKTVKIVATRHVAARDEVCIDRVVIDAPPMAVVSEVESIICGWWARSAGYPVGVLSGTALGAAGGR